MTRGGGPGLCETLAATRPTSETPRTRRAPRTHGSRLHGEAEQLLRAEDGEVAHPPVVRGGMYYCSSSMGVVYLSHAFVLYPTTPWYFHALLHLDPPPLDSRDHLLRGTGRLEWLLVPNHGTVSTWRRHRGVTRKVRNRAQLFLACGVRDQHAHVRSWAQTPASCEG